MTDAPQASSARPASVEQTAVAPPPASPASGASVRPSAPAEQTECSRAGCRDEAIWALRWRNPRIHAPERRKTWVACDEHVVYLREFLSARDFPVEVSALAAPQA